MEEKMIRAKEMYDQLCKAIDARNWTYTKKEEDLVVLFSVTGEDIPMHFIIRIDPNRYLVRLTSPLMFKIPENKRIEGAMAACAASYGLADGSFDYDSADGTVAFRMTATYRDSAIGDHMFQYMISCACHVVDEYNDKFLMLGAGKVDVDAFFH